MARGSLRDESQESGGGKPISSENKRLWMPISRCFPIPKTQELSELFFLPRNPIPSLQTYAVDFELHSRYADLVEMKPRSLKKASPISPENKRLGMPISRCCLIPKTQEIPELFFLPPNPIPRRPEWVFLSSLEFFTVCKQTLDML
ncbi:hypothetical protein CDAR_241791 [Caerostris darwini]|uniref:Uncharacterized protein n=1 Tax=Caerostris darwini TaxID=1538125 RepID=A0AAV4NPL8_9ARAC|nr:hypothetical protein CDAR_241791 [Caerostris darwini]